MKYYDRNLYEIEQSIRTAMLILAVFIISFTFGYFIGSTEINENQIEGNKILKKVEEI